jgi:hypothetical protein
MRHAEEEVILDTKNTKTQTKKCFSNAEERVMSETTKDFSTTEKEEKK